MGIGMAIRTKSGSVYHFEDGKLSGGRFLSEPTCGSFLSDPVIESPMIFVMNATKRIKTSPVSSISYYQINKKL